MKRTIIACLCLGLFACGGGGLDVPWDADAPACVLTDIASVTNQSNQPLPLTLLPYPVPADSMTVYIDGVALPRDGWELVRDGHMLSLAGASIPGDEDSHLVSVSLGCVVK
jgi:hypothetical protein